MSSQVDQGIARTFYQLPHFHHVTQKTDLTLEGVHAIVSLLVAKVISQTENWIFNEDVRKKNIKLLMTPPRDKLLSIH